MEPETEEDVEGVEDNTDCDPDFEETDQSTEGEAPEETFQSKGEHLLRSSSPQDRGSRARVENMKMTPDDPNTYVTCGGYQVQLPTLSSRNDKLAAPGTCGTGGTGGTGGRSTYSYGRTLR